jgi:hypothetical protein
VILLFNFYVYFFAFFFSTTPGLGFLTTSQYRQKQTPHQYNMWFINNTGAAFKYAAPVFIYDTTKDAT